MARTNTNGGGGGGSGTVTSVGLSLPSIFNVSGSPVTTNGTLVGALATQGANLVFAGPTAGGAALPAFRALVAADLPSLGGLYWSITGNAGTTPGTNFIGTTDDQDIVFKRNNIFAGRIQYNGLNLGNTSFGVNSADGTAIGSIEGLTAIGHNAANGIQPFSDGVTAIGAFAGANNSPLTSIEFSTFVGSTAGNQNTATEVVIIGESSGNSNTGPRAIIIGRGIGGQNSGSDVIIIGSQSAGQTNSANNSILLGTAVSASTDNEFAIATSIDHLNFLLNTGAAGYVLTTDGTGRADWQPVSASDPLWVIEGTNSLKDKRSTSAGGDTNFTAGVGTVNGGTNSVIISNGTTCNTNFVVAIGHMALNLSTGIGAIGIGQSAGNGNTGISLVAIGDNVGQNNSGDYVVGIGPFAAFLNTGTNVVAIGGITSGFQPTAGSNTGSNVIAIGSGSALGNTFDNVIALGTDTLPTSSNQFAIDPNIDHLNFPLNGGSPGHVLTRSVSGFGIWQPVALPSLANTNIFIGDGTNTAVAHAVSGDAVLSNTGVLTLIGSVRVVTQRLSLSSAQVLALNTSPFQLVSAPGAGKFIEVMSVTGRLTYNTSTYATNTTLRIKHSGTTTDFIASNGMILPATSSAFSTFILASGPNNTQENTAIQLFASGGDPTAGDSTLDIYITYKITNT